MARMNWDERLAIGSLGLLWRFDIATEEDRRNRFPRIVGTPFARAASWRGRAARFTNSTNRIIGRRIKTERVASGLRQIDLATAMGISQVHLSRIERGERSVTVPQLLVIAIQLRRPLMEFLRPPPKQVRMVRWEWRNLRPPHPRATVEAALAGTLPEDDEFFD